MVPENDLEVSAIGGGERAMAMDPGPAVPQRRRGPSIRRWRRRGEHLGLAFRAATVITRRLPDRTRYGLADIGGASAHLFLRSRAEVALQNYLVFTGGDRREAARLTRRAFRNYARTVMDFLVLEKLLAAVIDGDPKPETAALEKELTGGQPAIVVTPHFGNWDLGAAVTASCGRQVHAVADQFGPPAVDDLVRAAREKVGVRVIPTGPASARQALRALRQGDVLCLAADIDKSGQGVAVKFLGQSVLFPGGPATLAIRTNATLIPGYVRRLRGGGHEAALWPPLSPPNSGATEERVGILTQGIADSFEAMIRLDPSQWFAFHRLPLAPPGAETAR